VAAQQTSDARRVAEAELQRINTQLQDLARNINDPAIRRGADESAEALRRMAVDGATGLDGAVIDLRANLANLREGFAKTAVSSAVDGLTNMFAGLADGSKSLGQGLKDFARSFAASMAQVAARALATIAVLSLLEAIFPGAGKLIGGGGGAASVAINHAGGMAGTGPRRSVNPLVFAGAPRFHGGGLVGLAPDERPAILQTGERVLNRQQTADYNAGSAGSGGGTRVINVIDPNLVQDYMTSSAGERTILNVIERNRGAVRQKLA
jgi:lambda family phage tail tape measure protein